MELRPLLDVDLREALAPINRAARGEFLPALRTVAQLRERAASGVLDLKLSHAFWVGLALGATCLVEHLADDSVAHMDALAAESLAQQRGAIRALIEAVQGAAAAAGVTELSALVSEMDSTLGPALQLAGFSRRQPVVRYTLQGAPAPLALPTEVEAGQATPTAGHYASLVPVADVLPFLSRVGTAPLLFGQRPSVLQRLAGRLSALRLCTAEDSGATCVKAVVVFDRERKVFCALAGDTEELSALVCLAATRYGIAHMDAIAESHPAVAALKTAGLVRTTVRVELVCDPRQAVDDRQRASQSRAADAAAKGHE